jgi:hypothetical protein
MDRVYGRPGTTLGFLFRQALLSIAFLNVLSLSVCLSVYLSLSPLGIVFSPFGTSKTLSRFAKPVLIWRSNCQTKRESESSACLSIKLRPKDIRR